MITVFFSSCGRVNLSSFAADSIAAPIRPGKA
jgi:hypothetical protein